MPIDRISNAQPPQPLSAQRRILTDPITLNPIHQIRVPNEVQAPMAMPLDRYKQSDVHQAVVFWLEDRVLNPESDEAQYSLVRPQPGIFTGTYDPSKWALEMIHHSMLAMLEERKYTEYHSELMLHLWVHARTGKTSIPYQVISSLNEHFTKLVQLLPANTRLTFDLFFALDQQSTNPRIKWLTRIMSVVMPEAKSEMMQKMAKTNMAEAREIVRFFSPERVETERALLGVLDRFIDEERDQWAKMSPPLMTEAASTMAARYMVDRFRAETLSRYEDLTRRMFYQVILDYHTIERVLGTELIPVSQFNFISGSGFHFFNIMRFSAVDLLLCHELLSHQLPIGVLKYKWELNEVNPQKHLFSWKFEISKDAEVLREYHVTYFTRLGFIVIKDMIKGSEHFFRYRFSADKRALSVTGKLFGQKVVAITRGNPKTGMLQERFQLGSWYGQLNPDSHDHAHGEWRNRLTDETVSFTKQNHITKNAQSYYLMSEVITIGGHTTGGHYRYQNQLPLPLAATGLIS